MSKPLNFHVNVLFSSRLTCNSNHLKFKGFQRNAGMQTLTINFFFKRKPNLSGVTHFYFKKT